VGLLACLLVLRRRFLLPHQLADVVGGARDDALRRCRRQLVGGGEVEVVFVPGGERVGLFLAGLENAGEAVLGEGIERLLEDTLVDLGFLDELAEVRLAVDELEDLHQVLGEGRGFLVDLRDALRGLRENGGSIHPTPQRRFLELLPTPIMA
jgi:hypothetical protein